MFLKTVVPLKPGLGTQVDLNDIYGSIEEQFKVIKLKKSMK